MREIDMFVVPCFLYPIGPIPKVHTSPNLYLVPFKTFQ